MNGYINIVTTEANKCIINLWWRLSLNKGSLHFHIYPVIFKSSYTFFFPLFFVCEKLSNQLLWNEAIKLNHSKHLKESFLTAPDAGERNVKRSAIGKWYKKYFFHPSRHPFFLEIYLNLPHREEKPSYSHCIAIKSFTIRPLLKSNELLNQCCSKFRKHWFKVGFSRVCLFSLQDWICKSS